MLLLLLLLLMMMMMMTMMRLRHTSLYTPARSLSRCHRCSVAACDDSVIESLQQQHRNSL